MAGVSPIEESTIQLLDSVQSEWEEDLRWSAWLGAEGERVRDNASLLVQAAKSGTLHDVLGDASVVEFLGLAWIEVHSKSYERACALQNMVGNSHAA